MQSTSKHVVAGACKRLRARRAPAQLCGYATSSTDAEATAPPAASTSAPTPTPTPSPPPIRTAMLVHRAPLLTPAPHPLEAAYHAYSARLAAALANPPPTEFYFKKGSLLERRFALAQWEREREMFGARLAGKRPDVGDIPGEEAVVLHHREAEVEGEGDRAGDDQDRTKLERRGDRSLYLVVKEKGSSAWSLPSGPLEGSENLHESASRNLRADLGSDMDLWLVTRKPIALLSSGSEQTFVFKSHILAGQAVAAGRVDAFAWLTREEVREVLRGSGSGSEGAKQWEEIEAVLSA